MNVFLCQELHWDVHGLEISHISYDKRRYLRTGYWWLWLWNMMFFRYKVISHKKKKQASIGISFLLDSSNQCRTAYINDAELRQKGKEVHMRHLQDRSWLMFSFKNSRGMSRWQVKDLVLSQLPVNTEVNKTVLQLPPSLSIYTVGRGGASVTELTALRIEGVCWGFSQGWWQSD